MHDAIEEGEPDAEEQRRRGLARADRRHMPGDHAIGLALEGEQRPTDPSDRGPRARRLHRRRRTALRRRAPALRGGVGLAGEGVGDRRRLGQRQRQERGDGDHQDDHAAHQLVAQLRTMVSGFTMP
jgi:hypothetical protein